MRRRTTVSPELTGGLTRQPARQQSEERSDSLGLSFNRLLLCVHLRCRSTRGNAPPRRPGPNCNTTEPPENPLGRMSLVHLGQLRGAAGKLASYDGLV